MESEINRKGMLRHELLFVAVYFPTLALVTEKWQLWAIFQPLGIVIAFVYAQYFPDLSKFKRYFWLVQMVGLLFGMFVWLLPQYRLLLALLWSFGLLLHLWPLYQKVLPILSKNTQRK